MVLKGEEKADPISIKQPYYNADLMEYYVNYCSLLLPIAVYIKKYLCVWTESKPPAARKVYLHDMKQLYIMTPKWSLQPEKQFSSPAPHPGLVRTTVH